MRKLFLSLALLSSGCVSTENNSPKAVLSSEGTAGSTFLHEETFEAGQSNLGVLTSKQEATARAHAYFVDGLIHSRNKEPESALHAWEQVIQLDPERDDLRDLVLREYISRGELDRAKPILELGVQRNPKSLSYWTLLAVAYRSTQEWDLAKKAAEKSAEIDPTRLHPYQILYEVALEQDHTRAAKRALDRAAKVESTDARFWVQLAELYAALNVRDASLGISKTEIESLYNKSMQLAPDDPAVLSSVADYYAISQNAAKAVEIYQKILDANPKVENVRIKQALSYVVLGDKVSAVKALETVVEHEPTRYQVYSLIGELYEDLKNDTLAQANYRLSLSANPSQLSPYLRLVMIHLRQKNASEALNELNIAHEKFPSTPQISYFYGLVYSETKEYARAIDKFEESIQLASRANPELLDGKFYFYYGAALERAGSFEKSVDIFRKAIQLDPDNPESYNYLGYMYAEKNIRLDEAYDLVSKALSHDPENGAFLDSMGWVCYRQGKADKALNYLKRAVLVIHDDSVVFDHLGDVYMQLGNMKEAVESYQKAVDVDPKNPDAKKKLEKMLQSISSSTSQKLGLDSPSLKGNSSRMDPP